MRSEPKDDDEDALFAAAGRGDAIAFTRLVACTRSRLMAMAVRMTRSRVHAEDLVQEVYARAWREAPRFRPRPGRGGARAWLARVLVNLAVDASRRPRLATLDPALEPTDPAPAADSILIAGEDARRVRAAVAGLPDRQRAAVGLAYDGGLSNAEGAAAMGVSLGAYELLLVRARRTLRVALADIQEAEEGR